MKDLRKILYTALIPALDSATGIQAYTRMPKDAGIAYPFIYVGETYDRETGPKTGFNYEYDVQIRIVYKDLNDLSPLYDAMDKVKGLANNASPFALSGGHKIESCELGSSMDMEPETDSGTEHVGIIRLIFDIV